MATQQHFPKRAFLSGDLHKNNVSSFAEGRNIHELTASGLAVGGLRAPKRGHFGILAVDVNKIDYQLFGTRYVSGSGPAQGSFPI